MAFFTEVGPLREAIARVRDSQAMPMIQEFIPGRERLSFNLIADRDGEIKALLCPRGVRYGTRLHSDASAAVESAVAHPLVPVVKRLVREVGWWGGLTLQTKVDMRDGQPKLLEMNPRLGLTLWFRTELGCNEPLMCLRVARGEPVAEHHYPVGTLLLAPVEDAFRIARDVLDALIYGVRTRVLGKRPVDPTNPPRPLTELVRTYSRDYLGSQPKVFSPYWTHLFDDPLPCLLWCYALAGFNWRTLGTLGR